MGGVLTQIILGLKSPAGSLRSPGMVFRQLRQNGGLEAPSCLAREHPVVTQSRLDVLLLDKLSFWRIPSFFKRSRSAASDSVRRRCPASLPRSTSSSSTLPGSTTSSTSTFVSSFTWINNTNYKAKRQINCILLNFSFTNI